MRRDTAGALEDILESAGYIAADTAGLDFAAFERDRRARQLVERNVEIVGEAISRMRHHDPATAQRLTAYNTIVAFRNALSHGYDKIDYPTVWRAAQDALPVLRSKVMALLEEGAAASQQGGA